MSTTTRKNPWGLPVGTVVRLGDGKHTHILHPHTGDTLCRSGSGRAKEKQAITNAGGEQATCYRCAKLGSMNLEAGRKVWQGPRDA